MPRLLDTSQSCSLNLAGEQATRIGPEIRWSFIQFILCRCQFLSPEHLSPKSFHPSQVNSDRKQISLPIGSIRVRFRSILGPCWVHSGSVLHLSGRIECKFASDRPQVAPKSAHKQIKHIAEGFSYICKSAQVTEPHIRTTPNAS